MEYSSVYSDSFFPVDFVPKPDAAVEAADKMAKTSEDIRRYRASVPGAKSGSDAYDPFNP